MRRPQFSIRTLLWLTLVVAAFLGGMAIQRGIDERHTLYYKLVTMRDGSEQVWTVRAAPGEEK